MLMASIRADVEGTGRINYHNKRHLFHSQPIKGTGLYSITLSESRIYADRAFQILCLLWEYLAIYIPFGIAVILASSLLLSSGAGWQRFSFLIPTRDRVDHFNTMGYAMAGLIFLVALLALAGVVHPLLVTFALGSSSILAVYILTRKVTGQPSDLVESKYYTRNVFLWLIAVTALPCLLLFNYSAD